MLADLKLKAVSVMRVSGVSKKTLIAMESDGRLVPQRVPYGKKGVTARIYTIEDVYKLMALKRPPVEAPTSTIVFVNQKGGVGKSLLSTQSAMAASFHSSRPVLYIDLDPQGNGTSNFLGLPSDPTAPTMADVLFDKFPIKKAIKKLTSKISIIPSHLTGMGRIETQKNIGIKRIREVLLSIRGEFSFIVMDTNPSLSSLNLSATSAADEVYLISDCSRDSTEGIKNYLKILKSLNIRPQEWVVPNKMVSNRIDHKKNYYDLISQFDERVMSPIRLDSSLARTAEASDCYLLGSKTNGALDLDVLTNHILRRRDEA